MLLELKRVTFPAILVAAAVLGSCGDKQPSPGDEDRLQQDGGGVEPDEKPVAAAAGAPVAAPVGLPQSGRTAPGLSLPSVEHGETWTLAEHLDPPPPPSAAPSSPLPVAAPTVPGDREAEHQATAREPDYAARVTDLQSVQSALAAAVDAGDLGAVHPLAERAVDIAIELPGRATVLSDGDQAMVARRVAELREDGLALRDRADAGDLRGAKAALARVTAEVEALVVAGRDLDR